MTERDEMCDCDDRRRHPRLLHDDDWADQLGEQGIAFLEARKRQESRNSGEADRG